MPSRIIRDGLLDSDRYLLLPHDSERLLFIELLLLADDYGLCNANFGYLKRRTSVCSTKTVEQVASILATLMDVDLVRVYDVDGNRLLYIPRFGNHPRSRKPRFPMPPDNLGGNEINQLQEKRIASATHMRADALQVRANAPETETEFETEFETEVPVLTTVSTKQKVVGEKSEKKSKDVSRASRLPPTWILPLDWGNWAMQERPELTSDNVRKIADKFRDHFLRSEERRVGKECA